MSREREREDREDRETGILLSFMWDRLSASPVIFFSKKLRKNKREASVVESLFDTSRE